MARLSLARQGVRGLDHLGQMVLCNMGVDLRGRNVGVAQHGLYAAQIRSTFHKVRRKGVAQHMRRQLLGIELGRDRQLLEHLMTTTARQMSFRSARGKEKPLGVSPARSRRQKIITYLEIVRDLLLSRSVERRKAFLLALASDEHETVTCPRCRKWQSH